MMANALSTSIYDGMDEPSRVIAQEAAAHILRLQRNVVSDIAEIGKILLKVKEAAGHGNFLPWIKAEFGWTERTAQNYMSVAEQLGEKYEPVSHLPLKTIYALASPSTPEVLRNEIVAKLEKGETVEPGEIATELAEVRRAAAREREEEKELAKKSPESRARAKARKERLQAERIAATARWEEQQRSATENKNAAVAVIVNGLGEAEIEHLLKLMSSANIYISHRDLTEARDRLREQG